MTSTTHGPADTGCNWTRSPDTVCGLHGVAHGYARLSALHKGSSGTTKISNTDIKEKIMAINPLFTFEVSVYRNDPDPVFDLHMRYRGRIIWTGKTPVDFSAQDTDDPYEPSTPLTPADLFWALRRAGWSAFGIWLGNAADPGYMSVRATPTEFAIPQITLPACVLAELTGEENG